MKILLIEDEQKGAAYLRKGLSEHGLVVDLAPDGEEGLHLAKAADYGVIILDVMLPGRDGYRGDPGFHRAGAAALDW